MKNQHFYIFYSEIEDNDLPFKLMKAYMNGFCINEEDQSEVIEIYSLKGLRKVFSV